MLLIKFQVGLRAIVYPLPGKVSPLQGGGVAFRIRNHVDFALRTKRNKISTAVRELYYRRDTVTVSTGLRWKIKQYIMWQ